MTNQPAYTIGEGRVLREAVTLEVEIEYNEREAVTLEVEIEYNEPEPVEVPVPVALDGPPRPGPEHGDGCAARDPRPTGE